MADGGGTGGTPEHQYNWKQTLSDVTLSIPVPEGTRGKMLDVAINRKSLKALLKFKNEVLIDGELYADVIVDECSWSVIDQKELSITLEKQNGTEWWPHVITSDEKIEVQDIKPPTSNMSDLDSETRAMVEKMMYERNNPDVNGPTEEEQERSKILEQFKKQNPDLDFSQVENQQFDDVQFK